MDIERLLDRYPGIAWLRRKAQKRIPHFAWVYLDSGTGLEAAMARNHAALDAIEFRPRFMRGNLKPQLSTRLFGVDYAAPFGMAPVGLTGMMWPGAELMLARAARDHKLAYCVSMVVCETPESIGEIAGERAWFQLYTLSDRQTQSDVLRRVKAAGFSALVVTIDVPANSTRERQRNAGMRSGASSLRRLAHIAMRPAWAAATMRRGSPRFRTFDRYVAGRSLTTMFRFLNGQRLGELGLDDIRRIRDEWKGPLLLKGILDPEDARDAVEVGVDGIIVSNHGARQLDAAPAAIDALPAVVAEVGGKVPVLMDSGVRTGLDIARALALGADFVLCGRAFLYGVCALGEPGAGLVAHLLRLDLENNMIQMGAASIDELRERLRPGLRHGL